MHTYIYYHGIQTLHAFAGHNLNTSYQVLVVNCVYSTYDVTSVFYIYTYIFKLCLHNTISPHDGKRLVVENKEQKEMIIIIGAMHDQVIWESTYT